MICVCEHFNGEAELIRAGQVVQGDHPAVKRNGAFFMPARPGPTLDREAMRDAQRRIWAATPNPDVG